MRNGILAALAALLASHSFVAAQGWSGYYQPGYYPPGAHAWGPMGRPPAPPQVIRTWTPPGPVVRPPMAAYPQPQQPPQQRPGMAGWPPPGSQAAYDPNAGLVPGQDLRALPGALPSATGAATVAPTTPPAAPPPALLNPAPQHTTPVPPTTEACEAPVEMDVPPAPEKDVSEAVDLLHKKAPVGLGLWGSGEYLLWWFKNGHVPPLVTSGGTGIIGQPGTTVLLDNLDFDNEFRHGGRFTVGYQCKKIPFLGAEGNFFFISDRESNEVFFSPGNPTLARPILDAQTLAPNSVLVAFPGTVDGAIDVSTRSSLWGGEANLAAGVFCTDLFHVAALGGFRFLNFQDELTISTRQNVAAGVPVFGGSTLIVRDQFRADNDFYGGQLGLEAGVQIWKFTVDFRGKVAFGRIYQQQRIDGNTVQFNGAAPSTVFPGGVLALPTNIGEFDRSQWAYIPEVGLNLGCQLTHNVKLFAGYSFLWINNVQRAGEAVDPVVNLTQLPVVNPNGPVVGPPRPAFQFHDVDFWAQGINFGMELRF